MGSAGCAAIVGAYAEAVSRGVPIVGLWHSGGARLAEGVASLHAVGTVFAAMTAASGRVPQISVVLGPAAGGAAYGPALTDIVILSGQGRIFVTGPDVVRSVTGEDVDAERLGGPEPHSRRSGVVHVVTPTDAEALDRARELAAMLSDQGKIAEDDPRECDLAGVLPESASDGVRGMPRPAAVHAAGRAAVRLCGGDVGAGGLRQPGHDLVDGLVPRPEVTDVDGEHRAHAVLHVERARPVGGWHGGRHAMPAWFSALCSDVLKPLDV